VNKPRSMACEGCGAPASEITVMRHGVVLWRRMMCDDCFQEGIVVTQERTGLRIVPKADA
jgi:hypothetical protein